MKIAAYCRVSTSQSDQLDSLQHQKDFFTTYAQRGGYELVGLYVDEGISGTQLKKREAFQRLMQDARTGAFQMVVTKDISRFARNTVDALQSVRTLKTLGINTVFLTANMDSMGDSEFLLTLLCALAQEESANISKRTKFGKQINAEKGRVPHGVFGYDRVDNFTLATNPEEARIVRKIFNLYIHQGQGCRSISLTLNRDGDRTKLGCEWNARGVRRILVNPLYCGILVNHKYEIQDFLTGKQVALPASEHFFHQRPEWAIVSRDEFQRAQEVLESRRVKHSSGAPFLQGRYSSKHTFSTLIKCAHCGRSFGRKTYTYTNTRIYWRCPTNDLYTAEKCDNRTTVDEAVLKEQLRDYFRSCIPDREAFTADVLSALEQRLPKEENPVPELEVKRRKLQSRRERYQELYANDLLSLPELKDKLGRLQEELNALNEQISHLRGQENSGADALQNRRAKYEEEIRRFLDFETVTNTDLRALVDHITVDRDGAVEVVVKDLRKRSDFSHPELL